MHSRLGLVGYLMPAVLAVVMVGLNAAQGRVSGAVIWAIGTGIYSVIGYQMHDISRRIAKLEAEGNQ